MLAMTRPLGPTVLIAISPTFSQSRARCRRRTPPTWPPRFARNNSACASRGLPTDAEGLGLGGARDRRLGPLENATQEFNQAVPRDPRNRRWIQELADTFSYTRQFRPAGQASDRLTDLRPDQPILKV